MFKPIATIAVLCAAVAVYFYAAADSYAPIPSVSASQAVQDREPALFVSIPAKDAICVFALTADGDVAPLRTIVGPDTGLDHPEDMAIDKTGALYVANSGGGDVELGPNGEMSAPGGGSIRVFSAGAAGDAKPIRTIEGNETELNDPSGLALDATGRLYVANIATSSITVYDPGVDGDVAPIRSVGGANTGLIVPSSVAIAPDGRIFVADVVDVKVYANDAHGDVAPEYTIAGDMTGITKAEALATDDAGDVFVANVGENVDPGQDAILEFAADARGNTSPVRVIHGAKTGLRFVAALAISRQNIYAANNFFQTNSITVYDRTQSGDTVPLRTISGESTAISGPDGLAIWP